MEKSIFESVERIYLKREMNINKMIGIIDLDEILNFQLNRCKVEMKAVFCLY